MKAAELAAQAEKASADLNLSYVNVLAPVNGVVAQRRARVGGYARVGEPLLTLVPWMPFMWRPISAKRSWPMCG